MLQLIGYILIPYVFYSTLEKPQEVKDKPIVKAKNVKVEKPVEGCETEITKIYTKQNNLQVCLGDLLKEGQNTRIVYDDNEGE